jgi:hypothetical protein
MKGQALVNDSSPCGIPKKPSYNKAGISSEKVEHSAMCNIKNLIHNSTFGI